MRKVNYAAKEQKNDEKVNFRGDAHTILARVGEGSRTVSHTLYMLITFNGTYGTQSNQTLVDHNHEPPTLPIICESEHLTLQVRKDYQSQVNTVFSTQ